MEENDTLDRVNTNSAPSETPEAPEAVTEPPAPEDSGGDDVADLGDAVVVLAGRMSAAVLFRVDDHGAELEDHEGLAALGGALLLIEHRAAVVQLDGQSRNGKDGREDDERRRAEDYVENALGDPLQIAHAAIAAEEQGRVEQLDAVGGAGDDVRDLGDEIHPLVPREAELEDVVARTGGDIVDEHELGFLGNFGIFPFLDLLLAPKGPSE